MKKIWSAIVFCASVHAGLVVNGGFESGLSGWSIADQIGSDGSFLLQTGTASPTNGFPVAEPVQGSNAAMTDALGPGSHVLYQDVMVPQTFTVPWAATFYLYINNMDTAFRTPDTLAFDTPALNQRARVDLLKVAADPFTLDPADIILNLYETKTGSPLVSGYNRVAVDVTAALTPFAGQTVRLRFAEVDNVANFNFGVDNVDIAPVPEPGAGLLAALGLGGLCFGLRSHRKFFT